MPNLKDIRRRISSVKNTQKITRAMKLVSAAKFARANASVVAARPYGRAFDSMVERLVEAVGDDFQSPLLETRPEKRSLVVLLSTDRGFCGGLNSNLFKAAAAHVAAKRKSGVEIEFVTWGKRARQYVGKTTFKILNSREKVLDKPKYDTAKELATELTERFVNEGYDRVYVAFVEFKSALSQAPKVLQLLPLGKSNSTVAQKLAEKSEQKAAKGGKVEPQASSDIIVEPEIAVMLPRLLEREVASLIFRLMLEGAASEHGARMTSMDAATNNANEVLRLKKIEYNRARQAAITKELIEITSGAQAL